MGFLLDTHVFLWWLEDHTRLSKKTRGILANPSARVFVSAVSIWEMAIKISLKKLSLRDISANELGALPGRRGGALLFYFF